MNNKNNKDLICEKESFEIIGACMEVHKELGPGFLEAVYQEALAIEFAERGMLFEEEKELEIKFKGRVLYKKYNADFVCYGKIVVELKALVQLNSEHESQLLNYLKATEFKLGFLFNFGEPSLRYKRMVR